MLEPSTIEASPARSQTATPVGMPQTSASTGRVSPWGRWAFENKAAYSKDNPLAWYGLRNVAINIVGIMGLIATIVPTRMGMGKLAQWAEKKGYKQFSGVMSNTYLQNSLGVGVSFATFRTIYKMGQRAYDRVFVKPQSAEESTQAVHDLPKTLFKDLRQIAPSEYPATMTAAFALVGIRSAITGGAPELKVNHWRDVTGSALAAYPVFFELTEHMGRALMKQHGHTTHDTNEHLDKDKETFGEFLTRQLPAVAIGIVPYIGFNNLAYRHTGRQLSYNAAQRATGNRAIDGFWQAAWKERPYQLFWMYTLGRDLYMDAYDKVIGKVPAAQPPKKDETPSPKIVKAYQQGRAVDGPMSQQLSAS